MKQQCPNCLRRVDVSIYVSGQRIRCPRCHVPFEVSRDSMLSVADSLEQEFRQTPDTLAAHHPLATHPFEAQTTPSRPAAISAVQQDNQQAQIRSADLQNAPDFPGYELLSLLGQGAMGTVYLARSNSNGQTVALKMLAEQLQENSEFVARFEREIAALAAVKHPCVVQLLDMSQLGDRRYFAMEYVEGSSLRTELAVTQPVPARIVSLLRAVAEGLAAAHRAGVIHRDLKPENVIVTPDGGVRIVDFGLAGLFGDGDPHPNLTRSRVTMGTVNYMAPEQRTDAKYVDQRADIYALGVMLYEGLTGELPVGRFQLPSERGLGLPILCDTILNKALARDPKDRYQTCESLLVDLENFAKLLNSASLADTSPPQLRKPISVKVEHVGRYRRSLHETVFRPVSRLWTVAALASLLIAVLGFVLGWRWLSNGKIYELCIVGDKVQHCPEGGARFMAPALALVPNAGQSEIETNLGVWSIEGHSLIHQPDDVKGLRLQPTFARAIFPKLEKKTLSINMQIFPKNASAQILQLARSQGFGQEVVLSKAQRGGLAFAIGKRLLGAYLSRDGRCGYLDVEGGRTRLWEQMCAPLSDKAARLQIHIKNGRLFMQVDELRLPPHPVDIGAELLQPVLLCQNAKCRFSASTVEGRP